jgi:ribosomal protein L12E/L44/L45/RPP1/RPP2
MNPKQGHSYNPAMKDHKSLLREVVELEEKIIDENLKDMKKTRPLLFAQSEKKGDGEDDNESENEKEKDESEESEDSEDVDMNKPLGINAEIDRTNIKT